MPNVMTSKYLWLNSGTRCINLIPHGHARQQKTTDTWKEPSTLPVRSCTNSHDYLNLNLKIQVTEPGKGSFQLSVVQEGIPERGRNECGHLSAIFVISITTSYKVANWLLLFLSLKPFNVSEYSTTWSLNSVAWHIRLSAGQRGHGECKCKIRLIMQEWPG